MKKINSKITYKKSGVDTHAGQKFVSMIRSKVHSTHDRNVLGGIGGFSAAYDVSFLKNYKHPVLLSGTDGVGTKIEIARLLNKHDTIGIDLVAMCVNDLLVSGGEPLFFLDYISCGKLNIKKMNQIVAGISEGCKLAGVSLVGGETAEHPGIMKEDEYDLGGFAVGVVEKDKIIDGKNIKTGDIIIGLESSGPHSNGFSLLRKLYLKKGNLPEKKADLEFIKNDLMSPTKIYVKSILQLIQKVQVKGMVHITGGGFYENIPRVLPKDLCARIQKKLLPENEVFEKIHIDSSMSHKEIYSVLNMGIGYVVIVPEKDAEDSINILESLGEEAHIVGQVVKKQKDTVEFQ
ncbi:MAG: phosphoribosylformylglycinamidine cyclo-ligase [Leptospiraceae bacterium]|nr:phosphoribosylformylglycinamidine cyclo-ligase [Leptospiraceae bacterium]